jgi:hypothetical protein
MDSIQMEITIGTLVEDQVIYRIKLLVKKYLY